jgi:hypothetical protein
VCWKSCSSCWSLHLIREEFLLAPIHSPPLSLVRRIGPSEGWIKVSGWGGECDPCAPPRWTPANRRGVACLELAGGGNPRLKWWWRACSKSVWMSGARGRRRARRDGGGAREVAHGRGRQSAVAHGRERWRRVLGFEVGRYSHQPL